MTREKLTVLYPQRHGADAARERLDEVLDFALDGIPAERYEDMEILRREPERFAGRRLLFALPLGEDGINHGYYELLAWLRKSRTIGANDPKAEKSCAAGGGTGDSEPGKADEIGAEYLKSGKAPGVLSGSVAGLIIDARSELYTKSTARQLAEAANRAGCAFVGRPLVEATASLDNYIVQAANMKTDRLGAYKNSARILAEQVADFAWERKECPHLLVLHASNHRTSNTMAIWNRVREELSGIEIRELNLRNGTLEDCSGCPYQMCLHFGERGQCFYGGAMVEAVYPAVRWADAILLLCPNYNDALSANMTAFINRLTALFRTTRFYDKAMFAIIVSGYSGSDILAGQLITALNMNKTFYLPGNFCMTETGNAPGSALKAPGIDARITEFAENIRRTLCETHG